MNLDDPRNILLTTPIDFKFSLSECEKFVGCRVRVIELTLSDTDEVIKHVVKTGLDIGIKTEVVSWSPLIFKQLIKNKDKEKVWEKFSLLGIRIVGNWKDVNDVIRTSGNVRFNELPKEDSDL